jgi:phosphatidylglycerophosphate synthase
MRKIPSIYEDPINNIIINICEYLCPLFKYFEFTPNMITTMSFLSGVFIPYYIYLQEFLLGSIFLMVSYFFDCLDGHYARKYNQITVFGDYYDHVTDIIVGISTTYFIILEMYQHLYYKWAIWLILNSIGALMHFGYQELYYEVIEKKCESDSISCLKRVGSKDKTTIIKRLKLLRYLGSGSLILSSSLFLCYLRYTS